MLRPRTSAPASALTMPAALLLILGGPLQDVGVSVLLRERAIVLALATAATRRAVLNLWCICGGNATALVTLHADMWPRYTWTKQFWM